MGAVMVGLMAAGTVVKAFSSIEQGQQTKAAEEVNAQIAQQNAQAQADQYKGKALVESTQARQKIGAAVAAAGGSGVDPNSGSPLDVVSQTAEHYANDIYMSGLGAQQSLVAGQNEANMDRWQGRQAAMAGWIGGGADLMSGAAMGMYGMGYHPQFGGS